MGCCATYQGCTDAAVFAGYRPQFPYPPTPEGMEDQRCIYSFDGTNTPGFAGNIAANFSSGKIPLLLDRDADFYIRGIQVAPTVLAVGLEDGNGHPFLLPVQSGLPPTLAAALWSQTGGAGIVTLDSDELGVYCPAGARLIAYLTNPTAAPVAGPLVTVHGIKRYKGVRCP